MITSRGCPYTCSFCDRTVFESREEMDALYNWHVKRFYDSKGYRHRFARRLWQHRWSLWHILKHLPETIAAARYFSANKEALERAKQEFRLHPRQPLGLQPALSPELQADAIAAMSPIKVSRRVRTMGDNAAPVSPETGEALPALGV
jgi:hypothetical protein